jgi:hypothetical protein
MGEQGFPALYMLFDPAMTESRELTISGELASGMGFRHVTKLISSHVRLVIGDWVEAHSVFIGVGGYPDNNTKIDSREIGRELSTADCEWKRFSWAHTWCSSYNRPPFPVFIPGND